MIISRRGFRATRRGIAAIEFVIVLPLITILLLGLWEGGRLIEIKQIMSNAAREGARQAASGQANTAQVQATVTNYLQAAGLPTQNVVVTVQNLGFVGNPPPADNNPQDATQLDRLQVTVTMPFSNVRWIALNLATGPNTMLSAQSVWCSIKDKAYPPVDYPAAE
jgi:Flp pilus assembly protein TadG